MKRVLSFYLVLLILTASIPVSCIAENTWICLSCGRENTKNFCVDCGAKKPVWICRCGSENTTRYCGDCGDSHDLLEKEYQQASDLLNKQEYEKAIQAFSQLGFYQDAQACLLASYYSLGEAKREQKEWDAAIRSFKAAGQYGDAKDQINATYYAKGKALQDENEWEEAIRAFKQAGSYLDAEEQIHITYYLRGLSESDDEKWEEAIVSFLLAENYNDASLRLTEAIYQYAIGCFGEQKYEKAYQLFKSIENYLDATEFIASIENTYKEPEMSSTDIRYLPRLSADGRKGTLISRDSVYHNGNVDRTFNRLFSYIAPNPDNYALYPAGVLTFRGDNFRRNAASGIADVKDGNLTVLWQVPLGSLRTEDNGTLYGVGWTGQPAIVHWAKEVREGMNLYEEKRNKILTEVIFGAQDGKISFLDLSDGSASRDAIDVGYPMKGSVSVDCMGRPLMAIGQGLSKLANGKMGSIGLRLFNLVNGQEVYLLNGRKHEGQAQYSTNGAFDGTALFLCDQRNVNAMVVAGENGLLYTVDLNTQFNYPTSVFPDSDVSIEVNPEITYLRTKTADEKDALTSVESSVAMYDKYIYMADAYGIIRCVDSDTMTTVWAVDGGDNIDAAIALDMNGPFSVNLYTGNTCYSRLGAKNPITIRKLNALTGEEIWHYDIKCDFDRNQLSGCKASPVIGQNSIDNLVIFTVNKVDGGGSKILALEKQSGQVMWEKALQDETISSPVAVYDENGDAWIIQGDEGGNLTLLSGKTGEELNTINLGGAINGSPAVYKNFLVVGTCSKGNAYMYCIKIE